MNRGKNSNLLPGQKLAHELADLTIAGVPRRRQRSAKAAHLFGEAEIARGQAEYAKRHFGPASSEPAYQEYVAEASETKAAELLIPEGEVVHYDKANEVLLFAPDDDKWDSKRSMLVDTLINADMIAVDASEMRLEAVQGAGVLAPALDAVKTAEAQDSLSKMLVHQMTASHYAAMKLFERVTAAANLPPVEAARLLNTAARLNDCFQTGMITLQKIKTGGKQHVLVQHQHNYVNADQATIAQNIRASGGKRSSDAD